MIDPNELGTLVTAIGALGAASFGLVDTTKIGRNGGVSNSGFTFIDGAVRQFFPNASRKAESANPDDATKLLNILHGIWINGSSLVDQKSIAKSLIKLRLTPETADNFAAATNVDKKVFAEVAEKMVTGEKFETQHSNALGRFDIALTAILDEGYQRADQAYRNNAKGLASAVAIILAVLGGWTISTPGAYFGTSEMWGAVLCGLLATPLAPIAKDLTSALAAGVKVAQAIKR